MSHHLILLKSTGSWNPNGAAEYAKSARKYNIAPTSLSTFFVRNGVLKRFLPSDFDTEQEDASGKKGGLRGKFEALLSRRKKRQAASTESSSGEPAVSGIDPDGANENQSETEVDANDVQNDLEYVVPVQVGSQTLHLDFDTGSSDLWVLSTQSGLTSTQAAQHTLFDPTGASQTSSTWNISYGDGSSASGVVYTSPVSIGSITIPDQAVEVATKVSASFASPGSDGLLGLAWPNINTVQPQPVATPVENMINENLIEQPLFTVKLEKENTTGAASFYTFGYIDTSVALTSAFTYINVDNSNGFWEFATKGVTIAGQETARNTTAIADTGTTLLLVDDATVKAIYSQIPGSKMSRTQGGYIFPTSASLPDIGLEVNGTYFTIPGADLAFSEASSGYYFGAIQSRGQQNLDIWGDVFLKRVYAVFNQGEKTIGFAQRST